MNFHNHIHAKFAILHLMHFSECFEPKHCPDGEFECNVNICECPKRKFLGELGDTCRKCPIGEKPET